jgi:hypothetical protein
LAGSIVAAGVCQQLAQPLYSERRLVKVLEGKGNTTARLGDAAVLC